MNKFLIRTIYVVSIIGKVLYPEVVLSWLFSILDRVYVFNEDAFIYFLFFIIIVIELTIVFKLEKRKVMIVNTVLSFVYLAITVISSQLNISTDCGCFGEIIKFGDYKDKTVFNISFCVLSIVYMLNFKEKKNEVLFTSNNNKLD